MTLFTATVVSDPNGPNTTVEWGLNLSWLVLGTRPCLTVGQCVSRPVVISELSLLERDA